MNGNYHNTFIIAIIVIIVIFVFILFGCMTMKETFVNPGMKPLSKVPTKRKFLDTYVPSNLGYSDVTQYYDSMDNTLNGTPIVNVSAVNSNRFPIMIETSTNWYDTQPLVLNKAYLATNAGKLPKSDCICEDYMSLEFGI